MWTDSRRFLNKEFWVLYQVSPCEIWGGKSVNRAGFYIWVLRFSPDQYHSTILLRTHSLICVQWPLRTRIKWKSSNKTLKSRFVSVFKETLRDGQRFKDRLCLFLHSLCERQPSPSVGTTKDMFDRNFSFLSSSVHVTIYARRGYWAPWRFGV